jgi:hypothetical protein
MGRVSTGWRLAKGAWRVLKRDSSLAIYPVVSTVVALLAFWLVFGAGIAIGNASASWLAVVFLVVAIYVAAYVVVYFSVALAAAAQQSIDGRDTGLRDGLRVARTRRGPVAKWALLQVALGLLLSIIGGLLSDAGAAGFARFLTAVVGFAWSLASFFVIPVLALEGVGPRDALHRSADLVRARWGEAVVGRAGIGFAIFAVALVPLVGLAYAAVELEPVNATLAGVAYALFTLIAVVAFVIGSTLSVIFRVELYRYATAGELTGGFTEGDVQAAFRTT